MSRNVKLLLDVFAALCKQNIRRTAASNMINKRIEELQEYFRQHNRSKEQKAHTAKVRRQIQIGRLISKDCRYFQQC